MVNHKKNKKTEKESLQYLTEVDDSIRLVDIDERKHLLSILGVSHRFKKSFDCIRINVPNIVDIRTAADFDLIETKTTDKFLPNFPMGFFFGMTENEEMLLKVLEDKYFLCFVSLNVMSRKHKLVGWTELRKLTRNKRIQYQINLMSG